MKQRIAAVVPTCRSFRVPEQTLEVHWYIVHDEKERPVEGQATHIIAPDPSLYGSKCSCIRSAGFLQAYKDGSTHILTMDDDTLVSVDWAAQHLQALHKELHPWQRTVTSSLPMRGEPYLSPHQPVAISHGVWANVPDLDGLTQIKYPHFRLHPTAQWSRITPPFTLSNMNFGFRREAIPVMYEPMMGAGQPFNRFEDIWMGLLAERILSLHNYSFMTGGAVVWHTRVSDPIKNAIAERAAAEEHEKFWQHIWRFKEKRPYLEGSYRQMTVHVRRYEPIHDRHLPYFAALANNMERWLDLLREPHEG